jgi:hypothetical protein
MQSTPEFFTVIFYGLKDFAAKIRHSAQRSENARKTLS